MLSDSGVYQMYLRELDSLITSAAVYVLAVLVLGERVSNASPDAPVPCLR